MSDRDEHTTRELRVLVVNDGVHQSEELLAGDGVLLRRRGPGTD